ncbi:MAG: hypothetical protein ABFR05_02640 [Bacteroidota bacterium]
MKEILKKTAAIFMSLIVLFTTMSFTVSEHYCGDKLVDTAIFSKAESCGMEMEIPSPSESKDCSLDKEDCCNDITKIVEGQNELSTQISNPDFDQQVFIASFVYTYINLFKGLDQNIVPFKNYVPPLIVRDIQVLDNVFLI